MLLCSCPFDPLVSRNDATNDDYVAARWPIILSLLAEIGIRSSSKHSGLLRTVGIIPGLVSLPYLSLSVLILKGRLRVD